MKPTRARVAAFLLIAVTPFAMSYGAHAVPRTQLLARNASSITFGVNSPAPALQMSGRLKEFSGSVSLNPDASIKQVTLGLNLSSAQLPPDQLLQGFFLQSVLARFRQSTTTFTSSAITRVHNNDYLATGTYTWQSKTRSATVPFELLNVSHQSTEIRVRMKGALTDHSTPPELEAAAPGASNSTGWASAVLVFR